MFIAAIDHIFFSHFSFYLSKFGSTNPVKGFKWADICTYFAKEFLLVLKFLVSLSPSCQQII